LAFTSGPTGFVLHAGNRKAMKLSIRIDLISFFIGFFFGVVGIYEFEKVLLRFIVDKW
jgi:heme/copper-type cytochrome/quinol oxidase subunit 3